MPRSLAKALCASVAALTAVTAAVPAPAIADAMMSESAPSRVIAVPKDKSLSFRLDQPATKIVIAQPDIAEVVATTDRSFYVRGVSPGATNLLVYGLGGRLMEVIDVNVGYDGAALQRDISTAFPGEDIRVQSLGQGLLLTGNASTQSVATRAMAMAEKFAPDAASSSLLVRASQEVVLEVRVMEAARSALQDIGFSGSINSRNTVASWGTGLIGSAPATGIVSWTNHLGSVTVNADLQALEERGVVRTLARPTLVAVSGGKASFLAGGEFPYPVPQGLNEITIQFREYGVKLNFAPIVQDNGLVRMGVAPEVSQLDQTNALKLGAVQVPGLITRKADTTVELKDGDSLAIGGLFQHSYANDVRQFPILGSMPILGTLFRSARWNRNETELIIIVTPHVVSAQDFDRAKKTAAIGGAEPPAFDLMVNGRSFDQPMRNDLKAPDRLLGEPLAQAAPPKAAPQALAQAAPAPAAAKSAPAPSAPVQQVTKAATPAPAPAMQPVTKTAAPAPVPAAPVQQVTKAATPAPAPAMQPVTKTAAPAPVPAAPVQQVTKAATPVPALAAAPVQPVKQAAAPVQAAPIPVQTTPAPVSLAPVRPVAKVELAPAAPALTVAAIAPPPATTFQLAKAAPPPVPSAGPMPTAGKDAAPSAPAPQLRGAIAPKADSTGK